MKPAKQKKLVGRVAGIFLSLTGVGMVVSVVGPILAYEIKSRIEFPTFLSPVPENSTTFETINVNSFFPDAHLEEIATNIKFYTISVPKLKIKNATVTIGGEDLSDSLIQYPGTALPGKIGNTVVFGHSVLPTFYDPKVYLTIFSTLPTLKKGDPINIQFDGISYDYKVVELKEVLPTNLDVLSQSTPESTISLVTCVPPGDPRRPRRLVVRAKLVPPGDNLSDVNTSI